MICRSCGVEVEEKHSRCPLCGSPLHEADEERGGEHTGPETPEAAEAGRAAPAGPGSRENAEPPLQTRLRAGLWLIEAFTLVSAVGALVIFAADFAFSSEVGWSRYPLVSIALFWLLAVASVLFGNKPVLLSAVCCAVIAAFSYVIDRFTGAPFWFPGVAVPVLSALLLIVCGSAALALRRRFRLLQLLSLLSLDVGLLLVVVEAALQRYFTGVLTVTWSVLGFAGFAAVAVVIFYLHKNLGKRHRELRRYLHL